MAKAKKGYSIAKVKGTPHHELKIDESVIEVPKTMKREKYLFSSAKKAQNFVDAILTPKPTAV